MNGWQTHIEQALNEQIATFKDRKCFVLAMDSFKNEE